MYSQLLSARVPHNFCCYAPHSTGRLSSRSQRAWAPDAAACPAPDTQVDAPMQVYRLGLDTGSALRARGRAQLRKKPEASTYSCRPPPADNTGHVRIMKAPACKMCSTHGPTDLGLSVLPVPICFSNHSSFSSLQTLVHLALWQ